MGVVGDQVARPPAGRRAVLGPGARLVDVAGRAVDRPPVPVGQLLGGRLADGDRHESAPNDAAVAFPAIPARRRAIHVRLRPAAS